MPRRSLPAHFRPLLNTPSGYFGRQHAARDGGAQTRGAVGSRRLELLGSWLAPWIDALLSGYTCREGNYATNRRDLSTTGHRAARSAARPQHRVRPPAGNARVSRDLGARL